MERYYREKILKDPKNSHLKDFHYDGRVEYNESESSKKGTIDHKCEHGDGRSPYDKFRKSGKKSIKSSNKDKGISEFSLDRSGNKKSFLEETGAKSRVDD